MARNHQEITDIEFRDIHIESVTQWTTPLDFCEFPWLIGLGDTLSSENGGNKLSVKQPFQRVVLEKIWMNCS